MFSSLVPVLNKALKNILQEKIVMTLSNVLVFDHAVPSVYTISIHLL